MSKEIESVATSLFDKIRTRFENITLGDEHAKAESDPEKARFFNFTYRDKDGKEYGNVTISLIDEESLKVYFGLKLTREMEKEQRMEWYDFLRGLRKFAKRNLLTFDTRDISKSNLDVGDIKQQTNSDEVADSSDVTQAMMESRFYGSTYKSYINMGECRVSIHHSKPVSDEKRGDRSRNIDAIFLETKLGERLRMPNTSVHGACAMGRHLTNGGSMHDEFGKHINDMVSEMQAMSHFVRSTKKRQFEDRETSDMTVAATQRYGTLRETLRKLCNSKYYSQYMESYVPEAINNQVDVDGLRERFVKKVYDDRFNDALPYVQRAYESYKKTTVGNMGGVLESWLEDVYEDVFNKPDNDDKVTALQELMKQPLPVGIDGIDAQTKIEPVIGDDDLNDMMFDICQSQGADADARPYIKDWLQQHMPELLAQIKFGDKNSDQVNFPQPVSPQMSNNEYGAGTPPGDVGTAAQMTMEGDKSLSLIKKLAGLR